MHKSGSETFRLGSKRRLKIFCQPLERRNGQLTEKREKKQDYGKGRTKSKDMKNRLEEIRNYIKKGYSKKHEINNQTNGGETQNTRKGEVVSMPNLLISYKTEVHDRGTKNNKKRGLTVKCVC